MAGTADAVWSRVLRALARRRSVNLGLHGLGPRRPQVDPHGLWRTPERFAADVRLLQGAGFRFVTVAELAEAADGGTPPPGLATVSFDDGMQDNHDVALPLLEALGIPATVYVITGMIGAPNPWMAPEAGARLMNEDELRTLDARGIELGAHTVTHPDLRTLDYDACLHEVAASKAALERITGAPVRTFAYPHCAYGPAAVHAVRDAGFRAAVTCDARGGWNPLTLTRAMLAAKDGTASLVLKAADVYQPLFLSAPGRMVRGATRPVRSRLR